MYHTLQASMKTVILIDMIRSRGTSFSLQKNCCPEEMPVLDLPSSFESSICVPSPQKREGDLTPLLSTVVGSFSKVHRMSPEADLC